MNTQLVDKLLHIVKLYSRIIYVILGINLHPIPKYITYMYLSIKMKTKMAKNSREEMHYIHIYSSKKKNAKNSREEPTHTRN